MDNTGKDLVLQFSVKHAQKMDCGGGYIKLIPTSRCPLLPWSLLKLSSRCPSTHAGSWTPTSKCPSLSC